MKSGGVDSEPISSDASDVSIGGGGGSACWAGDPTDSGGDLEEAGGPPDSGVAPDIGDGSEAGTGFGVAFEIGADKDAGVGSGGGGELCTGSWNRSFRDDGGDSSELGGAGVQAAGVAGEVGCRGGFAGDCWEPLQLPYPD